MKLIGELLVLLRHVCDSELIYLNCCCDCVQGPSKVNCVCRLLMISRGSGSGFALPHVLTCSRKVEFKLWPCLVSIGFLSPKFAIVCVDTSLEDNLVSNCHYLSSYVSIVGGFSESNIVVDFLIECHDRLVRVLRGTYFLVVVQDLSRRNITIRLIQLLCDRTSGHIYIAYEAVAYDFIVFVLN